jgi:hypothetical protein
MWLAAHAFHLPGMAAGQLHRFEGIVFYFSGLVLLHGVVQRFDNPRQPMHLTTPLAWYYALTLAVPLANGAGRHGAAFVEYALFVAVLPVILVGLARAVTRLRILVSSRPRVRPQPPPTPRPGRFATTRARV